MIGDAIVRIAALEALAALISATIPELDGHVCAGIAPSSEYETVPNVSINPSRWTFDPDGTHEHASLPGNVLVWNVGQHTCACTISVVASSPRQRARIEAKIIDLFLSQESDDGFLRAGVIVMPITACPELSTWFASFELESDEWSDVQALDRRYESRIVCNGIIPALTIGRPVYTINSLILGVEVQASSTARASSVLPLVTINEDGSISNV